MRVYKHYRPRTVWFPLVFLGALGLAALGGLAWSASKGFDAQPPFPAFLLMLAIAGFNLWIVGGSALEIRLEDGGFVEFVAPLRKVVRIAALDIISIAPSDLGRRRGSPTRG